MNPFDLGWVPLMFSVSNVFWIKLIWADVSVLQARPSPSPSNQMTPVFIRQKPPRWSVRSASPDPHQTPVQHKRIPHIHMDVFSHTLLNHGELLSFCFYELSCLNLFLFFLHTRIHTLSFTDFVLAVLRSPPANLSAALIIGMMWLLHFKWLYR